MTTRTRSTRAERTRRGLRSLFLGWAGALLAASLLGACGKTDSQGSGETHFLSYCAETCGDGYECLCGACTRACDDDAACADTGDASSCVASPSECGTPARICDVECAADADCDAVDANARCRAGRCRVGDPPSTTPPPDDDPFAVCGDARPPSVCDFATTCASLECGGIQYDERGCARPECVSDADCSGGDVCIYTAAVNTGICEANASGRCDCGGPTIARPGAFCNPPDTEPPLGPLCDGSDGVRFALTEGGGFVETSYLFMNPHGRSFFAVDGGCRFYALLPDSAGIRSGLLDPTAADELADAAGWRSLPLWDPFQDQGCPDGGTTSLLAPEVNVSCSCGCDEGAPAGLADAITATNTLLDRYFTESTAFEGSVRVAAFLPENGFGVPPTQPILEWPLPWSVDTVLSTDTGVPSPAAGAAVEDETEAAALRALRAENEAAGVTNNVILVRAEDDTPRVVLVRDELPPEIDASLTALQTALDE